MVAIELVKPGVGDGRTPDPDLTKRIQAEALARHLIVLTAGTYVNVVRIIPPLVTTAAEVDQALGDPRREPRRRRGLIRGAGRDGRAGPTPRRRPAAGGTSSSRTGPPRHRGRRARLAAARRRRRTDAAREAAAAACVDGRPRSAARRRPARRPGPGSSGCTTGTCTSRPGPASTGAARSGPSRTASRSRPRSRTPRSARSRRTSRWPPTSRRSSSRSDCSSRCIRTRRPAASSPARAGPPGSGRSCSSSSSRSPSRCWASTSGRSGWAVALAIVVAAAIAHPARPLDAVSGIVVHPATPDRWRGRGRALRGRRTDWAAGASTGASRAATTAVARPGSGERHLHRQVDAGPPAPGLIAYSMTYPPAGAGSDPRSSMERLVRSRTIPAVDDVAGLVHRLLQGPGRLSAARRHPRAAGGRRSTTPGTTAPRCSRPTRSIPKARGSTSRSPTSGSPGPSRQPASRVCWRPRRRAPGGRAG